MFFELLVLAGIGLFVSKKRKAKREKESQQMANNGQANPWANNPPPPTNAYGQPYGQPHGQPHGRQDYYYHSASGPAAQGYPGNSNHAGYIHKPDQYSDAYAYDNSGSRSNELPPAYSRH